MSNAASTPAAQVSGGRGVAVLIGIDAYGGSISPLRNAVRDVQSVARLLSAKHGFETHLVLDSQATLSGLRALFSRLEQWVTADTRLVLYFAGHGIAEETEGAADGPRGFLIPQDARRDDPATFLPMVEVQALLAKLPCKHLLLLLDCCFAGAFRWSVTRSLAVRRKTLYRERYERYLRDPARQVITSASADEYALDTVAGGRLGRRVDDAEHSPFAAALCRALEGGADLRLDGQPGDGVILASELHLYLEAQFERLEQKLARTLQKPLLWALDGHDKGQFFFFAPGRALALPSALALNEANNPYRGLLPYGVEHAKEFFGRDAVVEALQKQVATSPLLVVSGVSGSGKSSIVRAGLLSRLGAQAEWQILPVIRPGQHPLSELSPILAALGASKDAALSAASGDWQAQNPGRKLLLVVDQLEELVTLGASDAEQATFLQRIREAVAASAGALHVVFTLRSDFEPHFNELLTAQEGGAARFLVTPPDRAALRQIIEGPASERVLYFEPATLVDRLIDEVADMPGALPLLSFTLSELYRAYLRSGREDRSLREQDYAKLGGVAGALSQRADEVFATLDVDHRETLRRVMVRMVSLQAGEVARRRVPLSELDYGPGHAEQPRIEAVLKQLQDARLVVAGRDSDGTSYVEPAHDKLILGWPRLWSFIKDDQETIPLQRLLTHEADTWEQHRRDNQHLWANNPRLPLALAQKKEHPLRWNARETAFIDRSERRRKRQQNIEGVLVIASLIVFGSLTTVALIQWREAVRQRGVAQTQATLAQQRFNSALSVINKLVSVVDLKLERLAGSAKIRGEIGALGRKLLADLGPATQTVQNARRTQGATLKQQAYLRMTYGGPQYLADAKRLYEQALAIDQEVVQANPKDAQAQRDLSSSLDRLGEVAGKMGQLDEAKGFFERALKIHEARAAADKADAQAQGDLANSLVLLADVVGMMGQLAEAKGFFERALKIREALAATSKTDAQAQANLSVSLVKLGDVVGQMGQLGEAKGLFLRALKIREDLAAADRADAQAQRDLSISQIKLGNVAGQIGQLGEAKDFFERALKIREALASADKNDAQAQRDLSISLVQLADAVAAMRQLGAAKGLCERALKISESLAAADKTDAQAQQDLAIILDRMGDVSGQMGQQRDAQTFLERSLNIRESLAAANKNDAQAQSELAVSLARLSDIARSAKRLTDAESLLRRALAIDEQTARLNPLALDSQRGLVFDHIQLGTLLQQLGQRANAQQEARTAAALLDPLRARLPKYDAENLDKKIRSLWR